MMFRSSLPIPNDKIESEKNGSLAIKQKASWLQELCLVFINDFNSESTNYENILPKIHVLLAFLKVANENAPKILEQEVDGKPFIYKPLKMILTSKINKLTMSTLMRYLFQHTNMESIEKTHSLLMLEWKNKFDLLATKQSYDLISYIGELELLGIKHNINLCASNQYSLNYYHMLHDEDKFPEYISENRLSV